MGTGAQGTTYQLSIEPAASAVNIYTIFGDADDDMVLPAGYQEPAHFGANAGGEFANDCPPGALCRSRRACSRPAPCPQTSRRAPAAAVARECR